MQHYVFSDIHGCDFMFQKTIQYMDKENPNNWHCYFLGDACDRGAAGWSIIKYLLNDSEHFTYLKGNHEDLLVRAGKKIKSLVTHHDRPLNYDYLSTIYCPEIKTCIFNGGAPTLRAAIQDKDFFKIIAQLDQLPTYTSYKQYDMCHAGTTIPKWNNKVETALLWDREHFASPWIENRVLIHGHTPIIYDHYFDCRNPYAYDAYKSGDKINLDAGTFVTNQVRLFNLDTAKLIIVKPEG